jgi:hypothetical protein
LRSWSMAMSEFMSELQQGERILIGRMAQTSKDFE